MDTEIDKIYELKTKYSSFIGYVAELNTLRSEHPTVPVAISTLIKHLPHVTTHDVSLYRYDPPLKLLPEEELGVAYILSDIRISKWIKRDLARMYTLRWGHGSTYMNAYRNVHTNNRRQRWCVFS